MKLTAQILVLLAVATLNTQCGKKKSNEPTADVPVAQDVIQCTVNINGEEKVGNSQEECDELTKEAGSLVQPDQAAEVVVQCSFNINGELFTGDSEEECDKLREELGITLPEIVAPEDQDEEKVEDEEEQSEEDDAVEVIYSCSYNINGVLKEGNSKAECEKIKDELGL